MEVLGIAAINLHHTVVTLHHNDAMPRTNNLKEGSWFLRFQAMVTWNHCSWAVMRQTVMVESMG